MNIKIKYLNGNNSRRINFLNNRYSCAGELVFSRDEIYEYHELALKVLLDMILVILLKIYLINSIITCLALAHTINWIINGHLITLMRYFQPIRQSPEKRDILIMIL